MIPERLEKLRQEMSKRGIAIYVIPTADFHESEYVGEHFKAREFMTGFTGSAGTAVITMTEAGLWTDGRYFLQAEQQLKDTTVTLYKSGEEGVPKENDYIKEQLPKGGVIGFDGRVVNAGWGKELKEIAKEKGGSLFYTEDLVDLVWKDRPPLSAKPVMVLEEKYCGKSVADKLSAIREKMKEQGASLHLVTSLYDINWILNVRGQDIMYVPVVLSYLALTMDTCIWFVQEQALNDAVRAYLSANHITVKGYHEFYDYVVQIPADTRVLVNTGTVNFRVCESIPKSVELVDEIEPSTLMKAVKNPVELENTIRAHIKDAVAMCRFMHWLKTNVGKIPMTEISVSDYLESLRRQQEGMLDLSFSTICGYAEHGAIVHYEATPETDVPLKPEGFLLVDSGGHYYEGTTDITRTFALGPLTEEMKRDFTRVLRSNLNLAAVRFRYGCTGQNFDYIARAPFWEDDMDYNHGTGHGVGYLLNVHEGPNGFRWRSVPERRDNGVFEEGMVTTDEPGIYIAGKYGIRTENELICRKGTKNEYGQFMYFETITYVPIDLDAVVPEQLSNLEKKRLNEYHELVYRTVAPYLLEEERVWLKEYTRAV